MKLTEMLADIQGPVQKTNFGRLPGPTQNCFLDWALGVGQHLCQFHPGFALVFVLEGGGHYEDCA